MRVEPYRPGAKYSLGDIIRYENKVYSLVEDSDGYSCLVCDLFHICCTNIGTQIESLPCKVDTNTAWSGSVPFDKRDFEMFSLVTVGEELFQVVPSIDRDCSKCAMSYQGTHNACKVCNLGITQILSKVLIEVDTVKRFIRLGKDRGDVI